jgi:transcriptional regulator with XRE-family HTH domain
MNESKNMPEHINYARDEVVSQLKAARKARGLSQTMLGHLIGLPQSHISKFESGSVDVQLSSLIEMSRALGLEIKLVPRALLPVIDGVLRAETLKARPNQSERPAYSLEDDHD